VSNSRTVILVRHANADWPQFKGRDFDRPLTPGGEQDAQSAGRALQAAGHRPDLLLVSPARRTQQTAAIIAAQLGLDEQVTRLVDALYNASPEILIAELRRATAQTPGLVMLVAHNPGVSELGRRLGDGASMQPFAPADWRVAQLPE